MKNLKSKITGYALWALFLLLVVTLVKDVGRASHIKSQIQAEKDKLAKIQSDNDRLAFEVAQTQSAEFIEQEVRNKLGLGKEGEAMVVLPDEETLRKLAPQIPVKTSSLPDPNWKKWVHLFTSK